MMIRPMQIKDISGVYCIEKESFSDPWSYEALAEECHNPSAIYYVAEFEGQIAAYGGVRVVLDVADVTNIAVAKAYRRQGLGRQLFMRLILAAREKGAQTITLEVRKSNEAAKRLYSSYDFKPIAVRKAYYRSPIEDAEIMQLKIE